MPRPSLKNERSEQILDAYLSCVARFGLEGATQERIAVQAGVKRPILRHYLGNKDQMIDALTRHVVSGFSVATEGLREQFGKAGTPIDLINFLFSDEAENDPRLMLAYQALVTSVEDHPTMARPLLDSMANFLDVIEDVLRRASPLAQQIRTRAITQGISAAYLNMDALSPLGPPAIWRDELKQAALILANTLEQNA